MTANPCFPTAKAPAKTNAANRFSSQDIHGNVLPSPTDRSAVANHVNPRAGNEPLHHPHRHILCCNAEERARDGM